MKLKPSILVLPILLGCISLSHATVIGFGQIGGSNTTVPANLGSNATADGAGFVVTNGATPNIALTWGANWDIHQSNQFDELENKTIGGGDWDNESGGPRIGQMDEDLHTIIFSADAGYALVLNSFDFANTDETFDVSTWDLTLTDSSLNVVWSLSVDLDNADESSETQTISPNFTGLAGETYTLTFSEDISVHNTPNGRHGIDNLSFTQVPEPSSAALFGLAGIALLVRRRK